MTGIVAEDVFGAVDGTITGSSTGRDGAVSGASSNVGVLDMIRKGVDRGAVDGSLTGIPSDGRAGDSSDVVGSTLATGKMTIGERGKLG